MTRLLLSAVLVTALVPSTVTAQSVPQPDHSQADLQAFHELVESCQSLGQPFTAFASPIARSGWPLPLRFVRNDPRVLFGSPYDPRTEAPLLALDLTELELLPEASAVRGWAADSSWAHTRCELLGHELAEAVEYARLADSARSSGPADDARFPTLRRLSHQVGLDTERAIARRQGTRLDPRGQPYGRTRHCFISSDSPRPAVVLVLGHNSVLWELKEANLDRIRYLAGIDACGVL